VYVRIAYGQKLVVRKDSSQTEDLVGRLDRVLPGVSVGVNLARLGPDGRARGVERALVLRIGRSGASKPPWFGGERGDASWSDARLTGACEVRSLFSQQSRRTRLSSSSSASAGDMQTYAITRVTLPSGDGGMPWCIVSDRHRIRSPGPAHTAKRSVGGTGQPSLRIV